MRKGLLFSAGILLLVIQLNFDLISYGFHMGMGQYRIIHQARPIVEVIQDPTISDSIKTKLKLVTEIKRFAVDSLGLKDTKNYTTFFDQHGMPLLWVLTASEKYKLQAHEWSFPFLGKVPYKGFFDEEDGKESAAELKEEGYDVDLGTTGGWSTLGWFKDPVLSGMLKQSEGALADLIIHEMTHGTLFVKDSVSFNENLASFIGEQGAVLFLQRKYGESSEYVWHYQDDLQREKRINLHFISGAQKLMSLYAGFHALQSEQRKDSLKHALIYSIFMEADSLSLIKNPKRLQERMASKDDFPNNTFFLNYLRYDAQKEALAKEMNASGEGNVKQYLVYLKQKYHS